MRHLGDITKIDGHKVPIVDCCIGGSPCQDLSLAGKRAGLDGERSGLFMEQIRIVKEMREEDERRGNAGVDIRPRYMVWENVPGAFSSNKGEDFRIVLEETAKVADKNAVIPRPENGKWTTSGCIMGKGWSVAWRVLDSQFFGTSDKPLPQRRRRIALVADFGGHSAPEILFVRQSVSGDIEPSKPKGKGTSSNATGGVGKSDTERVSCYGISSYNSNAMLSDNPHSGIYEAETSRTLDLNGGNPSCNQGGIMVVEPAPYTLKIRSGCEGGDKGALIQTDKSATLSTLQDQTLFQPYQDKVGALCARDYKGVGSQYVEEDKLIIAKGPSAVCYGFDPSATRDVGQYFLEEMGNTLTNGTCPGHHNGVCVVGRTNYIVRRLTPLECERLQGFPDGWTLIGEPVEEDVADYISKFDESKYIKPNYEDFGLTWDDVIDYQEVEDGELEDVELESRIFAYRKALAEAESKATKRVKIGTHKETFYYYTDANGKRKKCSDSARYKALGNSIAIPPWKWVLKRLCACYERDATMCSLFDGIGGFPYIWEQLNGKGSCLWASEIEEFPMAVTKERFGE